MNASEAKSTFIFKALERVLMPLIKLMLARGILYQQFVDWLKLLYVDTAIKHFSLDDKEISDSRISILTGVHRKDVKRLRAQMHASGHFEIPDKVNIGSQIVATWLNSPSLKSGNSPKKIPRLKKDGGDVSFEALAEKVTKDVRSRVILDELVRVGAASIDEEDMVSLTTEAFIPSKDIEEKAFYLGLGVGDHLSAAVHNVLAEKPAFYDRILHYSDISNEAIEKIEALSREHSSKLLQLLNAESQAILAKDSQKANKTNRFSLGVYFYKHDESDLDEN